MKSNIEEKLSLSHLSKACFYYFLFRISQFYFLSKGTILFIVVLVTIFQLFRYKRLYSLGIGCCLILIHLSITCLNSSQQLNSYLTQDESGKFLTMSEFSEVQILHTIKNKFYLVSISSKEIKKKAILFYPNRLQNLPTFRCEKNSITINIAEEQTPFFEFLIQYNSLYLKIKNCKVIRESYSLSLDSKYRVESLLKKSSLNPVSREIAMGLIFGDLSYVNGEFKNASREGGIIHLFAASGLHLGIILGVLGILMDRGLGMNYYFSKFIPLILGFIYLYLLGFPISLSRAYLFACFWVLQKITFRKSNPLNMIIICTACISLFQNDQFLSIGFYLSLGAVIGIFYIKNILDFLLFPKNKNFFTENFTVSLSAGLGTYPFLIYFFKSFSYGSLFLNLILVPIASLTLPVLFLSVIINLIEIPLLGDLLWIFSDILLRMIISLTFFLSQKYSFYRVYDNDTYLLFGYYFCLIIFFLMMKYFSKNIEHIKLLFSKYNQKIETILHIYKNYQKINYANDKRLKNLYQTLNHKLLDRLLSIRLFITSIFIKFLFLLIIFLFFFAGYKHNLKINKSINPIFKVGLNSFAVESNASLFIEGDCKYFGKTLKIYENKNHCKLLIDAHITHISCISFLKKCGFHRLISLHPPFFNEKNAQSTPKNFEREFPEVIVSKEKLQRFFPAKEVLFYAPHLEGMYPLSSLSKSTKGIIVLQLPFQSKDNSKEWNDNRNLLFIPDTWKFYTYNEL
jgi:ComEC/Rec2-related protein